MRNFDLSPLYRSAIGFDRLFNLLENNQSQSNGGYPPYNVELVDENHYRIAIAVAGFAESELEITARDNLLIVKGAHAAEQKERTYLYQDRRAQLRAQIPAGGKHSRPRRQSGERPAVYRSGTGDPGSEQAAPHRNQLIVRFRPRGGLM